MSTYLLGIENIKKHKSVYYQIILPYSDNKGSETFNKLPKVTNYSVLKLQTLLKPKSTGPKV